MSELDVNDLRVEIAEELAKRTQDMSEDEKLAMADQYVYDMICSFLRLGQTKCVPELAQRLHAMIDQAVKRIGQ